MTVNTPLMFKTLDYIHENPEKWDQAEWATRNSCGTVACFAGTAVLLAGYDFDFRYEDVEATDVVQGGVTILETARLELGLTHDQAAMLFYGENTLAELEEFVSAYTAELVAAT